MPTDPMTSVAKNSNTTVSSAQLQQQLARGLGELSLREALGWLLSSLGKTERRHYLERTPEDKGNGTYTRALMLGSLPVAVSVPRTWSGEFRPSSLPPHPMRAATRKRPRLC